MLTPQPSNMKRSPSFQKLRESIKRSSAKIVQKLTGTSDAAAVDFKYSTRTESLKARAPIIMSKHGASSHNYVKVGSNENLDTNESTDDDQEDDDNESNNSDHSSSTNLNQSEFFNGSKYQR